MDYHTYKIRVVKTMEFIVEGRIQAEAESEAVMQAAQGQPPDEVLSLEATDARIVLDKISPECLCPQCVTIRKREAILNRDIEGVAI